MWHINFCGNYYQPSKQKREEGSLPEMQYIFRSSRGNPFTYVIRKISYCIRVVIVCSNGRRDWDGCYKELFEAECQDEVEEERLIVGQDLPDGVFTVERLASL